jgi:HSP20 family protein
VALDGSHGVTQINAVPDAACRILAGNDGRTIQWPVAVISLHSEDVIVTHSSPALRDGRISAASASAIGDDAPNPSLRAELVGIRRNAPVARDFPPINIWLGGNSVVVTGERPGVTRDDVTLNLQEDVLTLEGARRPLQERTSIGSVASVLTAPSRARSSCPFRVDPDKVQARFNNGILEIEMERLEADRPKKIEIRAA